MASFLIQRDLDKAKFVIELILFTTVSKLYTENTEKLILSTSILKEN